jgi:hypothetical protein
VIAPPRVEMEVRRRVGARLRPVLSGESEGEQARTQEHEARRGYEQKSVRYEVTIAHGAPSNRNARPNLLSFRKPELAHDHGMEYRRRVRTRRCHVCGQRHHLRAH